MIIKIRKLMRTFIGTAATSLITAATFWSWNRVLPKDVKAKMEALQETLDLQQDTVGVKLRNWLSQQRWLGPLSPHAVPFHQEACPTPSSTLLFLPIVDRVLVTHCMKEYIDCMTNLLQQGAAARREFCRIACLTGGLVLTLIWFLSRLCVSRWSSGDVGAHPAQQKKKDMRQVQNLVTEVDSGTSSLSHLREEKEQRKEEEGDEEFLRRRIPFLAGPQVQFLDNLGMLGSGSYGAVWLVQYEGRLAARKELLPFTPAWRLLREARLSMELNGAGGVPRTLALCLDPPMVVLEFVGDSYNEYLEKCSVGDFLDSLVTIASRLKELHIAGIVHNDLKVDNITFSGSYKNPVFHIIDLGLACRVGEVADCYVLDENEDKHRWIAPEVKNRRPVFPSGDVHGFGALMEYVMGECDKELLKDDLEWMIAACMQKEALRRPSLMFVSTSVKVVKAQLTRAYSSLKLSDKP